MIPLFLAVACGLTVYVYARWLVLTARAKEAAESFERGFIPEARDINAAELDLPELRDTYTPERDSA